MDLKWIEDFLVLSRTNNFTRAAEERNVTQSAFSRRIRALEIWLGQPLIDRSNYPTGLTQEGKIFKGVAEDVFLSLQEVRNDFRRNRTEDLLAISTQHSLSMHFFPDWLSGLPKPLRNRKFKMLAGNFHDCIQSLSEGNCDFLLSYVHPSVPIELDTDGYSHCTLGRDRLMPVSAPNKSGQPSHILPGEQSNKTTYLAYDQGSFLGRALSSKLKTDGQAVHLKVCFENSLAEGLKKMALAGHGLAWIPYSCMAGELKTGSLVRAGSSEWDVELEVRLYRATTNTRTLVNDIWDFVSEGKD